MNWRRSEIISLGTLLTVAGWIWYASGKVTKWDVVEDMNKGNDALDRRVTIIETHIQDNDAEMLRLLRDIRRNVK